MKRLARGAWQKLERIAATRGYAIEWHSPHLIALHKRIRPDIEFVLPHLLLCEPAPFFLGIGANDGSHNDPLYPFIQARDLPGILLEPLPDVFARLAALHAGNPRVICVNAALAAEDGEATLYTVEGAAGLFSEAHQFSSFRKQSLLSQTDWIPDIAERIVERRVRTVNFATLQRMAADAGAQRIDILQTDTEGFDGEVLRMMWSSGLAPSLVNFEHLHMSKAEIADHIARFSAAGYLVSISDADVLAYRPPRRFTYREP